MARETKEMRAAREEQERIQALEEYKKEYPSRLMSLLKVILENPHIFTLNVVKEDNIFKLTILDDRGRMDSQIFFPYSITTEISTSFEKAVCEICSFEEEQEKRRLIEVEKTTALNKLTPREKDLLGLQ